MDKRKPFADIQSYAEYLRAVGFKVNLYRNDVYLDVRRPEDGSAYCHEVKAPDLGLHDTDPARKWENIANALLVLGPEMDRRGFSYECFIENLTHTDLLEAFYNAHAQGEVG